MAISSSNVLQRRTKIGLTTLSLLVTSAVFLGVAWAALGEEILTMPENRKEAAEIAARLQSLRTERDTLHIEIANLKNQVEIHRAEAEQTRTLAQELPNLQAEEVRARGDRDRLSKEALALESDLAVRREIVNELTDRERNLRSELERLTNRSQDERKRLEDVQIELDAKLGELAKTSDEIVAKRNESDRVNDELSKLEQSLATRSKFLNEVVADEHSINRRIGDLKMKADELIAITSSAENRLTEVRVEFDGTHADLEKLRKERDSTKYELDRVKALLDTTSTNKEAAEARLQNLISRETKIRHQLRTMLNQLQEVGLLGNEAGTTE